MKSKWTVYVQITEKSGIYGWSGATFRRSVVTRRQAESFQREVVRNGFRRRLSERTEFYPRNRIWEVSVRERKGV